MVNFRWYNMSKITVSEIASLTSGSDTELTFATGASGSHATRLSIASGGNVGIGDTSPTKALTLGTTTPVMLLDDQSSRTMEIRGPSSTHSATVLTTSNHDLLFGTNNTERARISSAGTFLVGRTADADSTAGAMMRPTGFIQSTRDGNLAADFNRLSSDGDIIRFQKDGQPKGTIGTGGGSEIAISTPSGTQYVSLKVNGDTDGMQYSSAGGYHFGPWLSKDDGVDLGRSNGRFDDVYATNGTIQTSDQNEKQDIASLTTKELNVAKKLSTLFKTFKWKGKVEQKGDKARTHSGIVAQEVQSTFKSEGLDASNYGLFISSTWWEKDNNVYHTEEEAPSGATKKSRLGVRYPELFSFIFSSIESRLTALESK